MYDRGTHLRASIGFSRSRIASTGFESLSGADVDSSSYREGVRSTKEEKTLAILDAKDVLNTTALSAPSSSVGFAYRERTRRTSTVDLRLRASTDNDDDDECFLGRSEGVRRVCRVQSAHRN